VYVALENSKKDKISSFENFIFSLYLISEFQVENRFL